MTIAEILLRVEKVMGEYEYEAMLDKLSTEAGTICDHQWYEYNDESVVGCLSDGHGWKAFPSREAYGDYVCASNTEAVA